MTLKEALPEAEGREVGADDPRYRFPLPKDTQERVRGFMMLKVVQMASILNAGDLLLRHGHVYEFMGLARQVLEAYEDVLILNSDLHEAQAVHGQILDNFYSEDIGFVNEAEKEPRGRRRGFLSEKAKGEVLKSALGDFDLQERKENQDLYSGHVHGRAPRHHEPLCPRRVFDKWGFWVYPGSFI